MSIDGEDDRWRARGKSTVSDPGRRTGSQAERYVGPFVRDGEELVFATRAVPVRAASGMGLGIGRLIGNLIARRGGVKGGRDSIAGRMPARQHSAIGVFSDRVGIYSTLGGYEEMWSAPRASIERVERRPRLQAMARARLHFTDGSRADFMIMRRRTVEELGEHLRGGGLG